MFRTRLMLRSAICLRGPRGVRLLYGAEGLTRQGALPPTALHLLQDKGSVQQMEGTAHHHRKRLFTDLLIEGPAAVDLSRAFAADWRATLAGEDEAIVIDSASDSLARVACRWAGLPEGLTQDARFRRTLFLMSAKAGRFTPATAASLLRRRGAEARLRREVAEARGGSAETPLGRLAHATHPDGRPLDDAEAAVELLNLLRPIVAVGRYVAFAAAHLAADPASGASLADPEARRTFAEEVRRHSPFFPFVAGVTTRALSHEGLDLPKGQWVIADLWGTLHDAALWDRPQLFRPSRALDWRTAEPVFCPQGAGDVGTTHRCPGEKVTVALIAAAVEVLLSLGWHAPPQDLSPDLSRIPAAPRSGTRLVRLHED
ncbi:cytochrome P450 [Wenxinia marina]|nr:cytochrome P450 [Wenxinia marina]